MLKPKLFVLSAPSGCGKTTIAKEILKRHPEMLFSVSATTRPKRDVEINGKDYFFLTKEEFRKKIEENQLVEWEEIYGNYYGSLRSEVEKALNNGKPMLFDIDVKGAISIKKSYPKDSVLIFIQPPSIEILTKRLTNRKTENTEIIKKRLERVPLEMNLRNEFHHCIINDNLEEAINAVDNIIRSVMN